MKPRKRTIEEILKTCLPSASEDSTEQVADLGTRVMHRMRTAVPNGEVAADLRDSAFDPRFPVQRSRWPRLVALAAAIAAAVVIPVILPSSAPATLESPDGTHRVEYGALLRAEDAAGEILVLADGSRVEMRSGSELRLERAADGVRIQLSAGGILVNAVKQRTGHLYVRTKDVMVSVVGTIFLVNAEEEGSRVAVIQGEVQVQRGAVVQKLLPGEQVVTSSAMPRVAPPTLALLRQSATLVGEAQDAFEVVSIRRSPPPPQGSRGGGGGGRLNEQPCFIRERTRLDPGRLLVTRMTLHGLIAKAYGLDCNLPDGIAGEPEWARSDRYDIEARIPSGSPAVTRQGFLDGNAPHLHRMLQRLLVDRFKLTLRREIREMPAYDMVVAKPGKWNCHLPDFCHGLRLSEDQDPEAVPVDREGMTQIVATLNLHVPISKWVSVATLNTGRPVIDKTGLQGYYDIRLEFPDIGPPPTSAQDVERLRNQRRDRFIPTIEEQLGFKLVPTTALVEVLIIEHVERPSEN